MEKNDLTLAKLLTFQFSLGSLLLFFLLVNSSPSPGEGRQDERVIDPTPTEKIDHTDGKPLSRYRGSGRLIYDI